jgi:tetratricopeptide (TPR) repeat protein
VPRLQRWNLARIRKRLWAAGRTLRGFFTTARPAVSTGSLRFALALFVAGAAFACAPSALAQSPAPATASVESWSRRLARSHFERALELEQRGDIAQALREYTESIAVDSTLGEAYVRLGDLRERMGDAREAELVYSEAARLGDSRAHALLQRSHLYRAAGRSREALRDLETSVELDANREALAELAHHYVEAHAWSAALATVRRLAQSALASGDNTTYEAARLEVRALRVLAAETDPSSERVSKHDWVGRALVRIAQH